MMRRTRLLSLLSLAATAPAAQAAVTVSDGQVTEGGKIVFTITSDQPGTFTVATKDGTAKAGSDYTAPEPATVNFLPPLQTSETVEVQTTQEGDPEPDETFIVTATPNTPGVQGDEGVGTIRNDDQPTLGVGDVSVSERAGSANVTVSSQVVNTDVAFSYTTGDDSANGSDYGATSGRLTIRAGQGSATVSVPITNDEMDEDDERFKFTIAEVQGAKVGDAEGVVTITNDDVRLISVGDIGVVEGDGDLTIARFPVQLTQPTFRTVTVRFGTIDATAKAPVDFLARLGTITFEPGQTTQFIDIGITTDDVGEENEFFGVIIADPSGAQVGRAAAVAAIRDDDAGDRGGADRLSPRMGLTAPRLSGTRSIRTRVTCPRGEQRCIGRLVLYARIGTAERRVGSKTFSLPGNAARTLRVTLPSSMASRGRRSGRLPIRAYLLTSDAAGNVDTRERGSTLRFRKRSRR